MLCVDAATAAILFCTYCTAGTTPAIRPGGQVRGRWVPALASQSDELGFTSDAGLANTAAQRISLDGQSECKHSIMAAAAFEEWVGITAQQGYASALQRHALLTE